MTYEVNGVNYSNMMITEEERAVVEAMRNGADVELWINFNSGEDAEKYVNEFPFSKQVINIGNHTESNKSELLYVASTENLHLYTKKRS